MKNIVIIYGGSSPEHDVSILTGLHCAKHTPDDYKVILIYLTRNNEFVFGSRNPDDYISKNHKWEKCYFTNGALYKKNKKLCDIYCVVNCCHGGVGESGDLSSYFNIAGIPITGCNYLSAYNQQSKTAAREILTANGFAQPKYKSFTKAEYEKSHDEILNAAEFPVVVKPDNLGSSIGVSVVKNTADLSRAVDVAFKMCNKIIIEEYINFTKEINIAVMRHNGELIVSAAETVGGKDFFSFDEKYLNAGSGFLQGAKRYAQKSCTAAIDEAAGANQPSAETAEIISLAKKAYEVFNSGGVVRSDFLITDAEKYLNENNTVPGFLAYHLWLKAAIPYGIVIEDIINEAVCKFNAESGLITVFPSDILQKNKILVVEK
jgi:D-alanine-D-alanine ligase